jgi:hypothetical protein
MHFLYWVTVHQLHHSLCVLKRMFISNVVKARPNVLYIVCTPCTYLSVCKSHRDQQLWYHKFDHTQSTVLWFPNLSLAKHENDMGLSTFISAFASSDSPGTFNFMHNGPWHPAEVLHGKTIPHPSSTLSRPPQESLMIHSMQRKNRWTMRKKANEGWSSKNPNTGYVTYVR